MRLAIVALFLSLSLAARAGDEGSFAESIACWRSSDAATRDAGSRLADRELRRVLAPLLAATRDDDPEVARRARAAILGLVGARERSIEELLVERIRQVEDARLRALLLAQQRVLAARRLSAKRAGARNRAAARRARAETPAERRVRALEDALGVTMRTTRHAGLVARGVRLMRVERGSRAEGLGLRRGDAILKANGKRVGTPGGLVKALGENPEWRKVRLTVVGSDGRLRHLPAGR